MSQGYGNHKTRLTHQELLAIWPLKLCVDAIMVLQLIIMHWESLCFNVCLVSDHILEETGNKLGTKY